VGLVITRNVDEAIVIRDADGKTVATVTVACVGSRQVKLHVEAPPEVAVWRVEIDPPNKKRR
jgi:carbon storage regulator CsrA